MTTARAFVYSGLIAIASLLGACTTTVIESGTIQPATQEYRTLAIGEITAADPLFEGRLPYLRHGLVEQLYEEAEFDEVLDPAPEDLSPGTLLLTGVVTQMDKGNRTLRWLVGFGAGGAHASGKFDLRDADGTDLGSFESRKAYAGGIGIGGFDLVDMDELMEKLGKETAKSVNRWVRGESLAPSRSE